MKNITKIDVSIIILILITIFMGVKAFSPKTNTTDYTQASYLAQVNQTLSDSIVAINKNLEQANQTIAKHQIVIENLKIRKNEKIKHIDTMSANDLYLFFSKQ